MSSAQIDAASTVKKSLRTSIIQRLQSELGIDGNGKNLVTLAHECWVALGSPEEPGAAAMVQPVLQTAMPVVEGSFAQPVVQMGMPLAEEMDEAAVQAAMPGAGGLDLRSGRVRCARCRRLEAGLA